MYNATKKFSDFQILLRILCRKPYIFKLHDLVETYIICPCKFMDAKLCKIYACARLLNHERILKMIKLFFCMDSPQICTHLPLHLFKDLAGLHTRGDAWTSKLWVVASPRRSKMDGSSVCIQICVHVIFHDFLFTLRPLENNTLKKVRNQFYQFGKYFW